MRAGIALFGVVSFGLAVAVPTAALADGSKCLNLKKVAASFESGSQRLVDIQGVDSEDPRVIYEVLAQEGILPGCFSSGNFNLDPALITAQNECSSVFWNFSVLENGEDILSTPIVSFTPKKLVVLLNQNGRSTVTIELVAPGQLKSTYHNTLPSQSVVYTAIVASSDKRSALPKMSNHLRELCTKAGFDFTPSSTSGESASPSSTAQSGSDSKGAQSPAVDAGVEDQGSAASAAK